MIELRSDTFTVPTRKMREAMATAPVGDDVYGEDPTVRRLEEVAADLLGKESACLMPSGTMANLAALLAQAPRGSTAIVGAESDIYVYEAAGASVCGGIGYLPVAVEADGSLRMADLVDALSIDPDDPQFARPAVICLENTQNRRCGAVVQQDHLEAVYAGARHHGVAVHLDGARLFNAAVAAGLPAAELARGADTVQVCLSKGLSAPIGSVLAGRADAVANARRARKMLGGGMRQAGIVAAAGLIALTEMTDRLADDHALARRLADGLATVSDLVVENPRPQTNIVMFRAADPGLPWQSIVREAASSGLRVGELGHGRIRAVTHRCVTGEQIDRAVAILSDAVRRALVASGTRQPTGA